MRPNVASTTRGLRRFQDSADGGGHAQLSPSRQGGGFLRADEKQTSPPWARHSDQQPRFHDAPDTALAPPGNAYDFDAGLMSNALSCLVHTLCRYWAARPSSSGPARFHYGCDMGVPPCPRLGAQRLQPGAARCGVRRRRPAAAVPSDRHRNTDRSPSGVWFAGKKNASHAMLVVSRGRALDCPGPRTGVMLVL